MSQHDPKTDKFGPEEAEQLTLALTQYINTTILGPFDYALYKSEYQDIYSLVLKFSSK